MRIRGWRKLAFFGLCVILFLWTIFPVYYMLILSLSSWDDLFKPKLYVDHPTFENFAQTLQESNYFVSKFWTQLYNSVSIALLTTAVVMVLSLIHISEPTRPY